jgi:stress-induced morphogen
LNPLKSFVERLKRAYSPSLILLFGSRARGDDLKGSDFDVIVVSKAFEGKGWVRRHEEAYCLWKGDAALDLLCYSPGEFDIKKRQLGIVRQALKEGAIIFRS